MALSPFTGRVFVVAGQASALLEVATALTRQGALVALISMHTDADEVAAHFRADPTDPGVWDRAVPHVEQRLGPIDAVITDEKARPVADRLVAADLARRGHGAVVTIGKDTTAEEVLRTLAGTL